MFKLIRVLISFARLCLAGHFCDFLNKTVVFFKAVCKHNSQQNK